ncbi:MAG: hypothetical protein PHF89_05565 [Eubacteriales bacterium]|nr:hypothetical protein [Eubacteriales bacterium]
MKEYVKPDLEVVKIRVEENFADNTTDNTTVYDFRGGNPIDSLALKLEKITFSQWS